MFIQLVQRVGFCAEEGVVKKINCVVFIYRAVGVEVAGLVEGVCAFTEENAVEKINSVVFCRRSCHR